MLLHGRKRVLAPRCSDEVASLVEPKTELEEIEANRVLKRIRTAIDGQQLPMKKELEITLTTEKRWLLVKADQDYVHCDHCGSAVPLSDLGLAKKPSQWQWRCNACVILKNHRKGAYFPPMLPPWDEPEE